MRIVIIKTTFLFISIFLLSFVTNAQLVSTLSETATGIQKTKSATKFDSFRGLVMTGYQGWFNAPNDGASNRDYREFGNMLFERKSDKYEVNNRIKSTELNPVIKKLTGYFAEFEKQISDEGKKEMVKNHVTARKRI